MNSNKKTSAVIIAMFVAAVIFFVSIIMLTMFLPDSDSIQQADYGMCFDSMDVTADWRDDRTCRISEEITARFFEPSHGIYVDIPVNSGEKLRNIKVFTDPSRSYEIMREGNGKIIRIKIGNEYLIFLANSTLVCNIEYDLITPEHETDKNLLALNAIGGGWTCPIANASVTIRYPKAPETYSAGGIWVGRQKLTESSSRAQATWSDEGKTLSITVGKKPFDIPAGSLRPSYDDYYDDYDYGVTFDPYAKIKQHLADGVALSPFEKVEAVYMMPKGTLKDRSDLEWLIVAGAGMALLILALFIKVLVKNKPITPVVDFYPPMIDCADGVKRRMLPVQMGKVIDGSCSPEDVTSLIFYWASKGFIRIDERESDTYFIKLKNIDAVTEYEREMFDSMFKSASFNADGFEEISMSRLTGKFGNSINKVKTSVNGEYGGKLYNKRCAALCVLMAVLCAAFGFCAASLSSLRAGFVDVIYGIVAAVCVVVSVGMGWVIVMYMPKLSDKKRILFIVLYVLFNFAFATLIALIVPVDVFSVTEKVFFAVCLGGATAFAPFYCIRTQYYTEQLNSIIGFRNFLRDAEKSRLEMLIADDPQYFYDILPYANVLGVSKIWEDKFADITIEPPTYYHSYSGHVFGIYMMSGLFNSVGQSLTYVPPSSKGSFSGGGGRGGGFSGGSFGGGGGGRW